MTARYLVEMVRRPTPEGCFVVRRSTPVVAFGDPHRARIATLGINPSSREFVEGGRLLAGPDRRLATLESLGTEDTSSLDDAQARQVLADCAGYFHRNPYRRWFDPLDAILRDAFDVSYFADTACHLYVVQWATDPTWSAIRDDLARRRLLEEGAEHLRALLEYSSVDTVIVNGSAVWNQLSAADLAQWEDAGPFAFGTRDATATLRPGTGCGVRFVGWTLNVQGSHGVTAADRDLLGSWLRTGRPAAGHPPAPPAPTSEGVKAKLSTAHLSPDGYLERTTVATKTEFAELLQHWFDFSATLTIGDVDNYGRRPIIKIRPISGPCAELNADTKRAAVQAYLEDVSQRGPEAPWRVTESRRGNYTKLNFMPFGAITSWNCYLKPAATQLPCTF